MTVVFMSNLRLDYSVNIKFSLIWRSTEVKGDNKLIQITVYYRDLETLRDIPHHHRSLLFYTLITHKQSPPHNRNK